MWWSQDLPHLRRRTLLGICRIVFTWCFGLSKACGHHFSTVTACNGFQQVRTGEVGWSWEWTPGTQIPADSLLSISRCSVTSESLACSYPLPPPPFGMQPPNPIHQPLACAGRDGLSSSLATRGCCSHTQWPAQQRPKGT